MVDGLQFRIFAMTFGPFFDGGPTYNFLNFVFSVAGVLAGLAGLWIALCQLGKTRRAAEAARDAALAASLQMSTLAAVVSISRLVNLATQLVHLLRSNDTASAAQRGLDLRDGAAVARSARGTASLLPPKQWQLLVSRIGSLHDKLEAVARRRKPDGDEVTECIKQAAAVMETLSGMTGTATNAGGVSYGNT